MNKQIAEFLSQCVCAKKKTDKFKKKDYSSNVLKASAVLQLCAIDLYEYNSKLYFTLIDIFSEFPFCVEILSKEATEVKKAFDKFCALFQEPENIFSDNGKEFALITVNRNTTPADYPQANGKIERFHKELGKLCRIHNVLPGEAVTILQTSIKKAIFFNGLQLPPILEEESFNSSFST